MKFKYQFGNHKYLIIFGVLGLSTFIFLYCAYFGKTRGWPFVRKDQIWSIGIYQGSDISNLRPSPNVRNPVLTAMDVTDVAAKFVADPFMIEHDGKWYMFFEVLNRQSNQGDIGLATSTDGLHWEYKQIVLDESFHLSYPYVFKRQNDFFMIPETSWAHAIRLYKAIDFPAKWTLHREIIKGDYADPSIIQYEGKWWLFACEASVWGTLHLFYADDLTGPWGEHPKSPIIRNNRGISRPGGRVIILDGHIVRFAQDCSRMYGEQLLAFEITELTETTYQEHELSDSPILKGSGVGWNAKGMHHIDLHRVGEDGLIGCVDGWQVKLLFGLKY